MGPSHFHLTGLLDYSDIGSVEFENYCPAGNFERTGRKFKLLMKPEQNQQREIVGAEFPVLLMPEIVSSILNITNRFAGTGLSLALFIDISSSSEVSSSLSVCGLAPGTSLYHGVVGEVTWEVDPKQEQRLLVQHSKGSTRGSLFSCLYFGQLVWKYIFNIAFFSEVVEAL